MIFIDFLGFSWTSVIFNGFTWICMDLCGFTWISFIFHGFERFWGRGVSCPLPPCGALCRPVLACRTGLDPPNIKISVSGGLDVEAWCLDAGCWQDWNGLEEVTEVTEGIGMGVRDWKKFSHARASGARRISRRSSNSVHSCSGQ